MGVPGLWDLIRCFKQECKSEGWNTSEHEDWIRSESEYHNFLWARTIHPSTFKKIVESSKCAIRDGVNYQVVDVAYTAWLFSESPPEELWRMIIDDHSIAERIAIFDLSNLHSSMPTCVKCNSTGSRVFKEFEDFIHKKFGAEFRTPKPFVTAQV